LKNNEKKFYFPTFSIKVNIRGAVEEDIFYGLNGAVTRILSLRGLSYKI
jgi:hypothetical protein